MSTQERRAEPRTEVTLKVHYSDLDAFLHDYTVNISRGGTMVRTRRQLSIGDQVQLVLSFPGLLRPIGLTGTVRWLQEEPTPGESSCGIAFDRHHPNYRELDQVVERIAERDARVVAEQTLDLLVVEDNRHVANLIRRGLEGHLRRSASRVAFEIDHALDGGEGLARLEAREYDLLLVDVFVPVIDGETLIRRLRSDVRWDDLPIIAISSDNDEVLKRSVLESGADFFLPKPLRLSGLLQTIHRLSIAL